MKRGDDIEHDRGALDRLIRASKPTRKAKAATATTTPRRRPMTAQERRRMAVALFVLRKTLRP